MVQIFWNLLGVIARIAFLVYMFWWIFGDLSVDQQFNHLFMMVLLLSVFITTDRDEIKRRIKLYVENDE